MNFHATITLSVILVLTVASAISTAQEAPPLDEAKDIFERIGCTSCHNGQTALTFEEAVLLVDSWRGKYGSLDEAVSAEVVYFGGQTFASYDEMFQQMAANVGKTLDDPDIQALYRFFEAVYKGEIDLAGHEPPEEPAAGGEMAVEEGPSAAPFYATVVLGVVAALVLLVAFARGWR